MPNRGTFDASAHNQFHWHTYPKGKGMRRLDQPDVAWWSDAGALVGIELPNLAATGTAHQGVTLGTPAYFSATTTAQRCAVLLDGVNDSISIGAAPYTEGYFDFRQTDTELVNIPNHVNYNLSGDATVIVRLAAGNWTPGGTQTLFSRWLPGANKSMLFRLNGQGRLMWNWSTDGTNEFQLISSVQLPVPSSTGDLWVAVAHDVNNGSGGNTVRFFSSTSFSEPTTMNLLSTHIDPSVTTSFFASAGTPIRLGSRDGNQDRLYGRVKTAIMRGSINALNIGLTNEVFRIDADAIVNEAATTHPVAVPAGQVATISGSGLLHRPVGGAACFGPEESSTIMICGQFKATVSSGARLFDSEPTSLMGGQAIHFTATSGAAVTGRVALAGVGTETTVAETASTSVPEVVCLRADRQASLLKIWTQQGGETTVALNALQGSSQRYADIRIGSSNENSQYANFDFYSGAIFRTAVSDVDRDLIKNMFLNGGDTYDDGDFWTVTTPGLFDGVFYMPGDQVLATGTTGMDFTKVRWARIPVATNTGDVVPAVPGYVDFPGSITNYMTIPNTTMAADASFDVRVECERPPNPATGEYRISDAPFYMGFSPTTIRVGSFSASDATTVNTAANASYATLEASGFPQVGQWVQQRLLWNTTTDVLTLYWRPATRDLADDTGWVQASTVTSAGKALRTTDGNWQLVGSVATTFMKGKVRRWRSLINGVLWRDVNASTNFTDGSVVTFGSTTGQTVTVVRTGSPSTKLVPTVPEHVVGQAAPPLTPTHFGIVEMNGPPSDLEVSFFEDSVIHPYRRLDIHNFDNSLWFEDAPLVSGSVNIDYSRDERRSGDCEVWLPETVIGPGGLWYDKVFKFYRGISFGPHHRDPNYRGASLVWQIGSFVADKISESSDSKNFKVTFRDLTKRMMLSKTTEAITFPEGTEIATVIRALAANSGIFDMLVPATGKEIGKDFTFEQGTSRWEIVKKIANDFGYELFFDHRGWLIMRPFTDPLTSPIYLDLVARRGGLGADGRKSNVGSYDRSASDERIYNHVVVIGEGTDRTVVYRAEAENNLPNSPTSITRIGRRTYTYTSSFITSVEQAQETANALLGINALEQFEINVGTVVYPWVEVGTTIRFDDDNPDDEFPSRYLLLSATVPLGLEAMSLSGSRVTIIGDTSS